MKNILFYSFLVLILFSACGEEDSLQLDPSGSNFDQIPPITQNVNFKFYTSADSISDINDIMIPDNHSEVDSDYRVSLTRSFNALTLDIWTAENEERTYCIYYVIFNKTAECQEPNEFGGLCAGGDAQDYGIPSLSVVKSCGVDNFFDNEGIISDVLVKKGRKDELLHMGSNLLDPLENPMGAEVRIILEFSNEVSPLIAVFPSPE